MYRVDLANPAVKRTLHPLYEQRQATPYPVFLDTTEAGDIYSGMVAVLSGADTVKICDGNADNPFGLFDLDRQAAGINDLDHQGDLTNFVVYIGGPDAFFHVDAPAFKAADTWTSPGAPIYAGTGGDKGQIVSSTPGGAAVKIGSFIELVSATRIKIRLFSPSA